MGGIRIGKIFGIPIRLNYSFLFLLVMFLLWQGVAGALLLVALFASVLIHELGHALVARRFGVPIIGIDLHFFGGAAKLTQMPDSPRTEITVAAAGPLVSFVLGGLLLGLSHFVHWGLVHHVGVINLVLGAFNLLPALPMDGGRILRAALSRRMGHVRATAVAVKVSRGCSVGLGVLGLVWSSFFTVALAVMLWIMAGVELRQAQMLQFARGAGWGSVANDEPEVLDRFGRSARGSAAGLFVGEEIADGRRCWVIRDSEGRIIFMCQQPLV